MSARFPYVFILAGLSLLNGCGGSAAQSVAVQDAPTLTQERAASAASSTPTLVVTPMETSASGEAQKPSEALNPLTGLPPAAPVLLDRRPIAVKVANYPRYMRPQSGLTLADQVFEYYIESELTRFVAVFYGNDSEWVGPVRSGRYFDEHVQRMYQAYLVFKFADPRELNYFRSSDFARFLVTPTNGLCPPFHFLAERARTVEQYNNSYFDTTRWKDCVAHNGMDDDHPTLRAEYFSESAPRGDLPGVRVYTYYSVDSYHYWEYAPETHLYYRYQETADSRKGEESYEALMDRVTGEQVHAANVVVLFANHTFANSYDRDDEVFQIDLNGSGEAYLFRDGEGFLARWQRTDLDQPLLLTTLSNDPIPLRPGITFYEVIGLRSDVDQGDGEWSFHHYWP